jgi:hypothetical protein
VRAPAVLLSEVRQILLLLFIHGALFAVPGPARVHAQALGIQSAYDAEGSLRLRLDLTTGDLCMYLACEDGAAAVNGAWRQSLVGGFSLPWIRVGSLVPAGILREAENPLGYSAASDVFMQHAGLFLDASKTGAPPGILCMPVPDLFGLFCVSCRDGGPQYGCFARFEPIESFGLEGFAMLSAPPPTVVGEEWLCSSGPFPGGALIVSAVKLFCHLPALSLSGTVGNSCAQMAPAGWFYHVSFQAERGGVHAALFLGECDGTYRTADGSPTSEAGKISGSFGFAAPDGSADFSYSLAVDQPGFAPGPFLCSAERIAAAFEKGFVRSSSLDCVGALKMEKEIRRNVDGIRDDVSRMSGAVTGTLKGGLEAVAGLDLSDPGGRGLFVSLGLPRIARRLSAGLDIRLDAKGTATPELSIRLKLSLSQSPAEWIGVEAGVADFPVQGSREGPGRHLVFKVTWRTRSLAPR